MKEGDKVTVHLLDREAMQALAQLAVKKINLPTGQFEVLCRKTADGVDVELTFTSCEIKPGAPSIFS